MKFLRRWFKRRTVLDDIDEYTAPHPLAADIAVALDRWHEATFHLAPTPEEQKQRPGESDAEWLARTDPLGVASVGNARWANAYQRDALLDVVTRDGSTFTLRGRQGGDWRWSDNGAQIAGVRGWEDDGNDRPSRVSTEELDAAYTLLQWATDDALPKFERVSEELS
jgi:hypothetical protein